MSNWVSKIITSLHGRRIGLQPMSTNESGGASGGIDFLVGPEALRPNLSTAPSTGTNLNAFGITQLVASTAGSSQVFTIGPPIPGVTATIVASTLAASYLKTNADATEIMSSQSSTGTVIAIAAEGGSFDLIGLTTAQWASRGLTSGTSSQSGAFIVSTST